MNFYTLKVVFLQFYCIMKIYGGDACLWLYPKHRPEAKRDLQLLNAQKMGEQPGEAVTAAMFQAMRDALAEQKQTPLSIDDSYLMQGIRL